MAINAQSLMDFLGSKGGQTIASAAGSGLSAYGQSQNAQANRQQQGAQNAATLAQQDFNNRNNVGVTRASGVLNADPLGADQQYAQTNALRAAILPQLRNANWTSGDPAVAAAQGSYRGIKVLPDGGLDPMMVNQMYGPQSTMSAITQHHQELNNLDPNAPTAQGLDSMYGDQQAAPYIAQMKDWAAKAQTSDANERAAYEAKINALTQHMLGEEQKSGKPGFWHKFAKIAGTIGGVAAMFIPGLQPVGMALIGAGTGAATAWGSGSSPLAGAVMGGAGGFAAGKAGAPSGSSFPTNAATPPFVPYQPLNRPGLAN